MTRLILPHRISQLGRVLCLFLWMVTAHFAQAQDVSDHVQVTPVPDWVQVQEADMSPFDLAEGRSLAYHLTTRQNWVSADDGARYNRFVFSLLTNGAVEDEGTVQVSFDPTYQSVKFHHIRIISDGQTRDVLDLDEASLYRIEDDVDKLIYDGRLRFIFNLEGVKTGDILDYAYTVTGRNPAFGPNYVVRRQQAYNLPIRARYNRMIIDDNLPAFVKLQAEAKAPEIRKTGRQTIITDAQENVPGIVRDDDTPSWYYFYPTLEVSSFETWADVGNFSATSYDIKPSAMVRAIARDIMAEHDAPDTRIRAALDYVQTEIRYLSLSMGVGGYEPRAPDLVLERRFGDCKDVTLLLKSILAAMNIDSSAMLVHTEERGGFTLAQPNYVAFDHVVLVTDLDDRSYVLDATRAPQLGNLQTMQQPNYQKGLRLHPTDSRVVDIAADNLEWRKDFVDTYDLVSDPDLVTFTAKAVYYGEEADWTKNWVDNSGMADVEKTYLDYFRDTYPTIEIKTPTEITFDAEAGTATAISVYNIPDAWDVNEDENRKYFEAVPYELRAGLPAFEGADRQSPRAVQFPAKMRQQLKFIVDDEYYFDDDDVDHSSDSFTFESRDRFDDDKDIYTETYTHHALLDNFPAENFADDMAAISDIRDGLGVTISNVLDPAKEPASAWDWLDNISDENIEMYFGIGILLAGGLALLGAIFFGVNADKAWRAEGLFYPVSPAKFIILTLATFGFYQFFWFYKNWHWLKTVREEDLWPVPRTIFAQFMNFDLFGRLAGEDTDGVAWFPKFALPLAAVFLVGTILTNVADNLPDIPEWTTLVLFVPWIAAFPASLHVTRMNSDRPDIIARNSVFDWRVWPLILVFLPITLPVYAGVAMIIFELF